jgi:hypothetical protein
VVVNYSEVRATAGETNRTRNPDSVNHEAWNQADPILQIGCVEEFPQQQQAVNSFSNTDALLRNEDEAWAVLLSDEFAEVPFHRVDIVTHQNPIIFRSGGQHIRIGEARQGDPLGSAKIHARDATQDAGKDRVLKVGVSLKPDPHANKRFRASSSRDWSSGFAGFAALSSSSHFFSRCRRQASTSG